MMNKSTMKRLSVTYVRNLKEKAKFHKGISRYGRTQFYDYAVSTCNGGDKLVKCSKSRNIDRINNKIYRMHRSNLPA